MKPWRIEAARSAIRKGGGRLVDEALVDAAKPAG
jgi:hypothetical protein